MRPLWSRSLPRVARRGLPARIPRTGLHPRHAGRAGPLHERGRVRQHPPRSRRGRHRRDDRQLRHGGVARAQRAAQQRPRGLRRKLLSGFLRPDGSPVRPSCRAGRIAPGPRGRLVHGRRHAPQRRADAHRLLPLHPGHEPPRRAHPGRTHARAQISLVPRGDDRIRILPGHRHARQSRSDAAAHPLLGGDGRPSRLRRLVAGARRAAPLPRHPSRRTDCRRHLRRRGLLRHLEPLPGHPQPEPRHPVPAGHRPLVARSMAQRQRPARPLRLRCRGVVALLRGALRASLLRALAA